MSVSRVVNPRVAGYFSAAVAVVVFGVSGCSLDTTTQTGEGSQVIEPVVVNSDLGTDDGPTSQALPPLGSDFDLDIDDQRGDGTFVTIESVSSPNQDVFVVITDRSGQVLGSGRSTPDRQLVTVELDSRVIQSQELYGSLYLDNGDGIFSSDTDQQLFDDGNELVEEDFDYLVVDFSNGATTTP